MPKDKSVDKQTTVTLGLAILIVGAAVSLAWWFGQWVGHDESWKAATDARLHGIEQAVKDGTSDRWKGADMRRWAKRLQESNDELTVPVPFIDDQ